MQKNGIKPEKYDLIYITCQRLLKNYELLLQEKKNYTVEVNQW